MTEFPHGHASMLAALDEYLDPPTIVVLRGAQDQLGKWAAVANAAYSPKRLVFAIPAAVAGLPGALAEPRAGEGTVAYLCRGTSCSAPLRSLEALAGELSKPGPANIVRND